MPRLKLKGPRSRGSTSTRSTEPAASPDSTIEVQKKLSKAALDDGSDEDSPLSDLERLEKEVDDDVTTLGELRVQVGDGKGMTPARSAETDEVYTDLSLLNSTHQLMFANPP